MKDNCVVSISIVVPGDAATSRSLEPVKAKDEVQSTVMGRTKRRRSRKNAHLTNANLNNDPSIISLKKWLCKNEWQNSSELLLKDFCATGRGVASKLHLFENDTLIEIPYSLMITYTTIAGSLEMNAMLGSKLKMQDLLSLYLALQKHKGSSSPWSTYINSMPGNLPAGLPLTMAEQEMLNLPASLRILAEESQLRFESSWKRVKGSIAPTWTCLCCEELRDSVLTYNLFRWAYAMVNTRAVYTDPTLVREITDSLNSLDGFLSDEPSMALCPFLDMFNHSHGVNTRAGLKRKNCTWIYCLETLTKFKKHQQIFISYGAHDNAKLLCEYGFFLRGNELDVVDFQLDEITKKLRANEKQYKFIRTLQGNLCVNAATGLSFSLKAVLYVLLNGDNPNWASVVYSDCYNKDDLKKMHGTCLKLLEEKSQEYKRDLEKFLRHSSEPFSTAIDFLGYKIDFVDSLKKHLNGL